ncbi:dihydrodipicolinate synthase family protein [Roseovarius sp. EL26]|uniref:dihydrodipicolinate synthase family protein n=1 Tax=Roseovarius sp. EL26 TaxID=2126672 RepID=UPI000EA0249D|nr:dihydrodipicolinate synthase family protein [Roseovarius sp. EL26]
MGRLPSVCAASIVPLLANGSIDRGKLIGHCRWLLANGCDGIVLFGTTGEAASFGLAERREVLEALIASGINANSVIVGTGCCSVADTALLSAHALDLGCAGILVHPPYFFRPASDNGVFGFYSELLESLSDSARDIIFYHFPEATGAPVNPNVISRLIDRYPEVFVGIKDSTGSLENMIYLAKTFPQLKVFSGDDNLLWPLLQEGGHGAITATANLTPNLLARVYAEWSENTPMAQEAQDLLVRLWEETLLKFPISEAVKDIVANASGDENWRLVRPPLETLPEARCQQLSEMVVPFSPHFPAGLGTMR